MMLLSTNSNQTKSESKAGNACRRHTSCYGLRGKSLLRGLLLASGLLMLGSCIDSSYDLGDVDATIGLGVNGLKVKLGNTEKIYLKDIIDTDGNTKLDGNDQFYITEQGSTDLSYTVQKVNSTIDRLARVKTKFRVLRWSDDLLNQLGAPSGTQVTVPANYTLHGSAEGENKSDFTTDDIGKEVVRITRVYPRNFGASLTVRMKSSANVNFRLDKLQKFAVTLPQYVHLREIPAGWRLEGSTLIHDTNITIGADSKQICTINIDYIDLKEEGTPKNGTITLPQEMTRVAMSGTAYFCSKSTFTMQQDDYADIELDINFPNDGKIVVDSIKGIFNPDINPNVNPIEIADNLPDFLKDDATKIKVSNPTLKFNVDMRTLPLERERGCHTHLSEERQGRMEPERDLATGYDERRTRQHRLLPQAGKQALRPRKRSDSRCHREPRRGPGQPDRASARPDRGRYEERQSVAGTAGDHHDSGQDLQGQGRLQRVRPPGDGRGLYHYI